MPKSSFINATVNIRLPSAYAPFVNDEADRVVVEYCGFLRTRVAECMIASVVAGRPFGHHVFLTNHPKRLNFALQQWFSRAGVTLRRQDARYVFGDCNVWILRYDEEVPTDTTHRLYLLDAHERTELGGSAHRTFVAGEFSARGHWFYEYARSVEVGTVAGATLHRVPSSTVAEAFRDEASAIPQYRSKLDPALGRRLLDLEDVSESSCRTPFMRFARTRLFIRSDKNSQFLNAEQQTAAARQSGVPIVPFHVNSLQRRYLAMKRLIVKQGRKPLFMLLKYRRGGYTTVEQGQSYELVTTRSNSHAVTLAHTDKQTQRIFGIAQLMHERDPQAPELEGVGNSYKLAFKHNRSQFFIGTAGGQAFGRGDTLQRVHGSEVAFWCPGPNQVEKVSVLVAGLTEAASNGEVVLESTPNGSEWFCQTYREAKKGQNDWNIIFIPWFRDRSLYLKDSEFNASEVQETLTEEESSLIARHRLNLAQIAWRRSKKRELKVLFAQEYPEDDTTCFLSSGITYFDVTRVLFLLSKTPRDCIVRTLEGGTLRIWEKPVVDELYVLGGDTSEGLPGCDPNGFVILNKRTGLPACDVHGYFSPARLAAMAYQFHNVYNRCLCGIERNNHGHATLQKLVELGMRSHEEGGKLFFFADGRAGWDTNTTTRPIMLSELSDALEAREMVDDPDFLDECSTFRLQKSGKFEADSGCHDDRVMKYAVAEQMRKVRIRKPGVHMVTVDGVGSVHRV